MQVVKEFLNSNRLRGFRIDVEENFVVRLLYELVDGFVPRFIGSSIEGLLESKDFYVSFNSAVLDALHAEQELAVVQLALFFDAVDLLQQLSFHVFVQEKLG